MKLLAVRLARSIWLMPPYFFNPKGAFLRPAAIALKERYNFRKSSLDNPQADPKQPNEYSDGAFVGKNGTVQILSMKIHDDGLVVDTRSSTDDGDAFLEDATTWVSKEYGLPSHADLPIHRIYTSELNVVFEKPPLLLNPKLAPFFKAVSAAVSDESTGDVDFMALYLSTDQTRSKSPRVFRIDREVNTPHDENRYYSFSPTKTEIHMKLLASLEELS